GTTSVYGRVARIPPSLLGASGAPASVAAASPSPPRGGLGGSHGARGEASDRGVRRRRSFYLGSPARTRGAVDRALVSVPTESFTAACGFRARARNREPRRAPRSTV